MGWVLFSVTDSLCDLSFGFRTPHQVLCFLVLSKGHTLHVLFREGAAARAVTSCSCTAPGVPTPCIYPLLLPRVDPTCRSWGTYFILKMAVSQEQKPCCRKNTGGSHVTLCSLLPAPSFEGSGDQCPRTSTDSAQDRKGPDHEHRDVQSHGWAQVKEMTVPLHRAQHRLDSATWLSPTNWQLCLPSDPWAPG